MKRFLLSLIVFILSPGAFAEMYQAQIQSQNVQILGDSQNPPSCRLYRKRLEQVLQREDEAARAHFKSSPKLTLSDIRSIIEIHRRAKIPLDLGEEKVLWTINFNLGSAGIGLDKSALKVQMASEYLNWESEPGFFPEHFQVQISESGDGLSVNYKMSFLEACVGKVGFSISVSDNLGTVIQATSPQGQDLL